ncbi:MAG TPA: trypsin-like serine protease [Jatrophihabitantaceae bacterium]|jgi:hypothetical protein|nr:trypsin-like serine protease [Jatrophihabitantaceae bacterium]
MASSGGTGRIGWVVLAAVGAALIVMIGRAGADAPKGSGDSAAAPTTSAMIGPLFAAESDAHPCTASVVDSPDHNLIMTAAHCVQGTGAGMRFIPDYQQSSAPYGAWVVHAAYVDPQWKSNQNPLRDWAFLAVTPHISNGQTVNIQDLTSAFRLGFKWHSGDTVTAFGYYKTTNDPTTCTDQLSQHNQYAEFKCEGFGAGMSGAPFLSGPSGYQQIVGVIGGLQHGGCTDDISYASQMGWPVYVTYLRAASGAPSDQAPTPAKVHC